MCQICIEAVKKYWPDLAKEHYEDLLWGATCFPFGQPEDVIIQLKNMAAKSRQNLDYALAIADRDMYKRWYGYSQLDLSKSYRQIAALRGQITRLKNKLEEKR